MPQRANIARPWARLGWIRGVLRLAILAGTLAFVFGLGAWLSVRFTVRSSPEVAVPELIGRDLGDAERLLRAAGLVGEVVARRYDQRADAGRVIGQIPGPASATRPGRPVRMVVSLGARRVVVPDVGGANRARAEADLRTAGLEPGPSAAAPDAGTARGRVLGQHPPAGTEAAPGDRVNLLFSSGPPPARYVMPDLAGRSVVWARGALTRRGFRNVTVAGPGGESPIRGQQPRAGYPVTMGEPIVLTTVAAP